MRIRITPAVLLLASALAACSDQSTAPRSPSIASASNAKGPPPPPTSVNVTTTIYDADAAGTALLTRSDDFNGTGFAMYTAVNNITSHVSVDGGWQLLLANQTARTIRLTLASQGIPLPDGNYSASVEVYSGCFDQSLAKISLLSMAAGASSNNCSFGADFTAGRTKYKLAMSPVYAGTGTATVTCNAVTNGYCSSWTILPNASDPHAGVANLYYCGHGGLVLEGTYHNSYSITIHS